MDTKEQTEQWRAVSNTDGKYEVSNLGRVRSLQRNKVRIMPMTRQPSGREGKLTYYAVTLWIKNKAYCRKVHRMVAEAFIPNPESLPQINHKDGDKTNNVVANLEWCTAKENTQHAIRNGLFNPGHNAHHWTDEERKQISQRMIEYYVSIGRHNTKPRRTRAEYQTDRQRKAEERKILKALQPKPPRKKWSEDAKLRVSEQRKGKPHPKIQGIKHWKWSEETKLRVRMNRSVQKP